MSVRVVARIRPLLAKELEKDVIVVADSNGDGQTANVVKIPSPKNEAEEFSFAFNSVYDRSTTQEALFNAEVSPHIKALFQGLDLTIFAYGVTGTGKTHTMRGGLKLADRGVIPRLLSHVFRRCKKIAKDSEGRTTADVALSYYEIYNDKVYDLLEPPEKRTPSGLPLREKDGKTCVVGLSEQACADLRDFERLYIAANQNRVTASTKLNAHSSRSHAILRVKLTQTTRATAGGDVQSVRESTASAIDLAGSEDNRRTDNDRQRLVESAAINKSLFVLSQCVDAIARGEKRIPYRESKMTRILSLGQNHGITVMILNLAPVRSYHLDTLSSLNVSSRAKRIEVREIENEVVFKMPPRSMSHLTSSASSSAMSSTTSLTSMSSSGSGLARQPLRALTSNVHNIQSGLAATKAAADKPVKAFSVYADRAASKPSSAPSAVSSRTGVRRSNSGRSSSKRPSDPAEARPSKLARPTVHPHSAASLRSHAQAHTSMATTTTTATATATAQLSTEQIEAIIERKVAEALAARAQEEAKQESEDEAHKAAQAVQTVSESVQRRLDALERRIGESERTDDPRAEGLRCLLLARQHKEVGDDAAALRYYEQALPFFPGQAKLLGKIEKLKVKLGREGSGGGGNGGCGSPSPRKAGKRKRAIMAGMAAAAAVKVHQAEVLDSINRDDSNGRDDNDADTDGDADAEADAEDDAGLVERSSPRHKKTGGRRRRLARPSPRKMPRTPTPSVRAGTDADADAATDADDETDHTDDEAEDADAAALTPRKRRLLDIVNSRDVARIRGLAGVGAKKARDLVDFMEQTEEKSRNGDDNDNRRLESMSPVPRHRITTLEQLRSVPGMGGRTVERAYEGLVV